MSGNLSAGLAASATLSSMVRCKHCDALSVMEITIIVNGKDVDDDSEVSGRAPIVPTCYPTGEQQ